jgi:ferredoxin
MKKILIYILIFIASLLYCAEKTSVEGKLITNGKKWFIKNETGFYILNLAPNEWFEEKNIILEADKTVKAIGELKDKELYVNVLFIDNEICVMRDGQSNPLWKPQIKYTHKVEKSKCIGCALCVKSCPVDAITMYKGKAVIDSDKCINCQICVIGNDSFLGCPTSAISKIKLTK